MKMGGGQGAAIKGANGKPELPTPETIYYKEFHFLEEPLINRKPASKLPNLTL
jgi:hypothetical protein